MLSFEDLIFAASGVYYEEIYLFCLPKRKGTFSKKNLMSFTIPFADSADPDHMVQHLLSMVHIFCHFRRGYCSLKTKDERAHSEGK